MNDQARLESLADEILLNIRSRPGRTRSLVSLAKRFNVGEPDVAATLRIIRDWGYRLRTSRREVTFLESPDLLTATEICYRLKTKIIGQTIHAYQSVKSTNDVAAQLAASGAPEGTIVTAEIQTKGRGRLSRNWHSPPGCGIYVSIILRPSFPADQAPGLSIMTALALADTIEPYCPDRTRMKWPNDVLVSGRKVAGILTELTAERRRIEYVVLGVGINVNHRAKDFPPGLKSVATSLRRATRRKHSRVELLKEFLVRLEKEYLGYQKRRLATSRTRLRWYSSLIGDRVKLARGRQIIEGVAVDVGADGSLILKTREGTISVSSGEVTVVKE
jgi:BirA family biotin operon repressor/biotin-[acetyl-CoA-carboxylase] ligase